MIRTYFGLEQEPFHPSLVELLPAQEEIISTLRVHCQQGGLCVLLGQPGTGKSVIKHALRDHDPKTLLTPTVNRTLHTYLLIPTSPSQERPLSSQTDVVQDLVEYSLNLAT